MQRSFGSARRVAFLSLFAALSGCETAPRTVPPSGLRGALDQYLSRIEGYGFSGVVLVARGDSVLLSKGYGCADTTCSARLTPRTAFYGASLSKQFTATLVMQLVEQGRLALTDSLPRFFQAVPPDKRGITVQQLLTHTSGLTSYHDADGASPATREEWVRSLLATPLDFTPGSRAAYSNSGFSLLAAIVEQVSGHPFEEVARDRLFVPAGFRDTWFASQAPAPGAPVASGVGAGIKVDPRTFGAGWGEKGASGLMTSVEDLWRWELALRSGTVILPASFARMIQSWVPVAPGVPLWYGYGWRVQSLPRVGRVAWVSGLEQPFSGMYRRYLDAGLTIIFLSNGAVGGLTWRDALFFALREGAIGQLLTGDGYTMPPWFDSTRLAPGTYDGTYRHPAGGLLDVTTVDGAIRLTPGSQDIVNLLLPPAPDTLVVPVDSLTARVREALAAPGADTNTALGLGPLTDEGHRAPSPSVQLGALRGVDWLVTVPVMRSPGSLLATTYGMLRFEKGTRVLRWRWSDGDAAGRDLGAGLGPLPPFRPQGADVFVSYSLSLQRAMTVRFSRDSSGVVTAMHIVNGTGGSVTLPRIPPSS